LNLTDPNNPNGGGSAILIELDAGALGNGILVPQTATTFTGNNGVDLHGFGEVLYLDIVGQVSADSPAVVTGAGDANEIFIQELASAPLSASFTADSTNSGRYTGTFDVNNAIAPYGMVFYQTNNGLALHILEDAANTASGVFEQQQ